MNSYLILFFLILIICVQVVLQMHRLHDEPNMYGIIKRKRNEHFSDSPLLVWKTSLNVTPLYLLWDPSCDNPWKNNVTDIKNLQFVSITENSHPSNLLTLIDAYSFSRNPEKMKILTVIPERSSLLFLKPRGQLTDLNLIDIINAGHIIGYTSDYQRELIEIIALSLSINKSFLRLKRVVFEKIDDDFFKTNIIDVLSIFTPINNPLLLEKFDQKFKIDFVDYQGVDINLIKYYFPPALVNNTSLDIFFPSYRAKFPIKKTLDIDLLLVGSEPLENNLDLRTQLFELIVTADNYDVNNLYNMWFPVFSQTQQYIASKNSHTQSRDNLTILEQYSDYFEYTPTINVVGYYDSKLEKLKMNSDMIQGVPLRPNWKIILQNQDRPEENGEYFVENIYKTTTILKKTLVLNLTPDEFTITKNTLTPKTKITAVQNIPWEFLEHNNKLSIPSINRTGYRSGDDVILHIVESQKDDDGIWSCTDPTIKIKGLCISKYDIDGKPKQLLTYWDRPCKTNTECEYYQANKNYRNYRGGCQDGYCEMPLGVDRIAYRIPDRETKPLCYGCHGINNGECCEDQEKNPEKYGLKSADYVYPLDSFERLSART